MKRSLAVLGLTLTVCALAWAQDNPGRIVVPARNTTRPRVVNASSTHGSITVKAYNGKEVIVETSASSRSGRRNEDRGVDGLHRIDMPASGLSIEEEDNVITIRTRTPGPENLVISVPA